MIATAINPSKDYLVLEEPDKELSKTNSLQVELNDVQDDFVLSAKVLRAPETSPYPEGSYVVFHTLEAYTFRDELKTNYLVKIENVIGSYTP